MAEGSSGEAPATSFLEIALASLSAGDLEEARDALEECLALTPRFAPGRALLAFVLQRQGHLECALEEITRAIALRPDNDADLHNRAVILASMRRHREAMRDYERALELNPGCGGTHNNLAWLLATTPDSSVRNGPRAVAHARRSLRSGVNGAWLDTLAAALAESGDYEQAVEVEQRAYAMSKPPNESFRRRIEIYRQHISYAAWRERRAIAKKRAQE